jgi:hypothetical protein
VHFLNNEGFIADDVHDVILAHVDSKLKYHHQNFGGFIKEGIRKLHLPVWSGNKIKASAVVDHIQVTAGKSQVEKVLLK